jgi:hypothetical protein
MLIQSGTLWKKHGDPEWNLDEGTGPRSCDYHITFSKPYKQPPGVSVALSYLDAIKDANLRIKASTKSITVGGFEVVFETWTDTHIWGAGVSWIAYGEPAA